MGIPSAVRHGLRRQTGAPAVDSRPRAAGQGVRRPRPACSRARLRLAELGASGASRGSLFSAGLTDRSGNTHTAPETAPRLRDQNRAARAHEIAGLRASQLGGQETPPGFSILTRGQLCGTLGPAMCVHVTAPQREGSAVADAGAGAMWVFPERDLEQAGNGEAREAAKQRAQRGATGAGGTQRDAARGCGVARPIDSGRERTSPAQRKWSAERNTPPPPRPGVSPPML